jgi:Mn-dependent DtxR family transcriptional regulator
MSSGDDLLLITVLDLFIQNRHNRPRTLGTVARELNVPEETALSALERLERMDVLVRARGGTHTPVWKPR